MIWVCCQLGGREHYAVPRAVSEVGRTVFLITDAWVRAPELIRRIPGLRRLGGRGDRSFPSKQVIAFSFQTVLFEVLQNIRKREGWELIVRRNRWFQEQVVLRLRSIREVTKSETQNVVLFAYSYAALECLKVAKEFGWLTILGQIDPAITEERIVSKVVTCSPDFASRWVPAPPAYWEQWREEVSLADWVVVNSKWSADALISEGVPAKKLVEIPLGYGPSIEALNYKRPLLPLGFSPERPLRVLFLGQVVLRKGVAEILKAADLLLDRPVIFDIVGPIGIEVPKYYRNHKRLNWIGAISRSEVSAYYRRADIFLFPTFSDGFGLTQLEAFSWGLPIIASLNCARVVQDGVSGILLKEVTARAIANAIVSLIETPERLAAFVQQVPRRLHGLHEFGKALDNLCNRSLHFSSERRQA